MLEGIQWSLLFVGFLAALALGGFVVEAWQNWRKRLIARRWAEIRRFK